MTSAPFLCRGISLARPGFRDRFPSCIFGLEWATFRTLLCFGGFRRLWRDGPPVEFISFQICPYKCTPEPSLQSMLACSIELQLGNLPSHPHPLHTAHSPKRPLMHPLYLPLVIIALFALRAFVLLLLRLGGARGGGRLRGSWRRIRGRGGRCL